MNLETPTPEELRKLRILAVEFHRYRERLIDKYFMPLLEMPDQPDFDEEEYYRMLEAWNEEFSKDEYHFQFRMIHGLLFRDNAFGHVLYEVRRRLYARNEPSVQLRHEPSPPRG